MTLQVRTLVTVVCDRCDPADPAVLRDEEGIAYFDPGEDDEAVALALDAGWTTDGRRFHCEVCSRTFALEASA